MLAAAIGPAMELLLEQGAFVQRELLKGLLVSAPGGGSSESESGLGKCTSILQNCLEAMGKLKVAMFAQLNADGSAKTQYWRIKTLRMALSDFLRIFRVIKSAELLVLQSQKRPATANRKLQAFRKSLDAEKSALLIGWLPTQQDARTWSLKAGNSIFAAVSTAPRQWITFQKQVYIPLQQLEASLGLSITTSMSFTQCHGPEPSPDSNPALHYLLATWKKCKLGLRVPNLRRASENDASPRAVSVSARSRSRMALRRFTVN